MNGTEMNTLTLSRPVTDSLQLHDHRIDFIFIYLNIYILSMLYKEFSILNITIHMLYNYENKMFPSYYLPVCDGKLLERGWEGSQAGP